MWFPRSPQSQYEFFALRPWKAVDRRLTQFEFIAQIEQTKTTWPLVSTISTFSPYAYGISIKVRFSILRE